LNIYFSRDNIATDLKLKGGGSFTSGFRCRSFPNVTVKNAEVIIKIKVVYFFETWCTCMSLNFVCTCVCVELLPQR